MSQFKTLIAAQHRRAFLNPDIWGADAGEVVYLPPGGDPQAIDRACVLTDEDLPEILAAAVPQYVRDGQSVRHFAALELPSNITIDIERGAFKLNGDRYTILKQVGKDVALQTLLLERIVRTDATPGGLRR
jgi:hypothetical protein